jgi:pyrroline-5-carboxylate reductase
LDQTPIAIIGAGNIGVAIANGLYVSGCYSPQEIVLTRRNVHLLEGMREKGFVVGNDNREAVRKAEAVILAVEPHQFDNVLAEIATELIPGKHVVISVVTGVSIQLIQRGIVDFQNKWTAIF